MSECQDCFELEKRKQQKKKVIHFDCMNRSQHASLAIFFTHCVH